MRTPLGACELADELRVVLGVYQEAGSALERAPTDDPLACELGKPAAPTRAALFRIDAESSLRFWATGGPYPDLSGLFPPTVIRVYRGCPGEPGSTLVACGATVAVDLQAGKYFVATVHTSPEPELARNPPTGALAYRLSALGDSQCPEELGSRRLDDWMGEAPPRTLEIGDLNRDGREDAAVEYRAASNARSTRVLVAAGYPECLRTVLDGPVVVKVEGGESGGWKNLRATTWTAPLGDDAGELLVAHRASFDTSLGRYVEGKPLGCSVTGPSDTPKPVPCPPAGKPR